MKNLALYTKFKPEERVKKTREIFSLMYDKSNKEIKDKDGKVIKKVPSSFETLKEYGIEFQNNESIINGEMIRNPCYITGNKKLMYDKLDRNPVNSNQLNSNKNKNKPILALYYDDDFNYYACEQLEYLLQEAGNEYNLSTPLIEWAIVNSYDPKKWKEKVEYYNPQNYCITLFIIDEKGERLYNHLKKHSLVEKGYPSQIIKAESILGTRKYYYSQEFDKKFIWKRGMSVASKVLCQINNKLGGHSYQIDFNLAGYGNDLMIIGVDSSHISGKRTGVAMVATTDKTYMNTYSFEDIIEEKNKE